VKSPIAFCKVKSSKKELAFFTLAGWDAISFYGYPNTIEP